MSKVLIADDKAIFREPISAILQLAGYTTICAADGKEALERSRSERPDLILTDIAMPVMSGLKFLEALRADPQLRQTPVLLLTALSDKKVVEQAAQLGAQGYLLKASFSRNDLLDRIQKCLSAASENGCPQRAQGVAAHPTPSNPSQAAPAATLQTIPRVLDRDACIRRAEGALQAKTLSGVVAQVVALAASPRGDMSQLATLIGRDPVLSARVLQAANSAAYASNRGVIATIPEAVKHIGCSTIRNIAAAAGIFDAMPETGPAGFNPIRCWQHSFATAQLCERLAAGTSAGDNGAAYLIGLCHDLSEILFYTHFAGEYQQMLELHGQTGLPLDELERTMLGVTRRELAPTIQHCLGLPETIRTPIETFHRLRAADRLSNADPLVCILHMAELYANGLLLASGGDSIVAPFSRAQCRAATGRDNPEPPDGTQLRSEILSLTGMLARLSRDDEQKLMVPLYPQKDVRVWLARDPSFSLFDPVQSALESMAQVKVSKLLPDRVELAQYQALVILARSNDSPGLTAAQVEEVINASDGRPSVLWLNGEQDQNQDGPYRPNGLPIALSDLADFIEKAASWREKGQEK